LTFESVDKLQNFLAKEVFHYTKDAKKASGRALGTFVEIITFYLASAWGLSKHIVIEERVLEYGNPTITHNVEYSLHPVRKSYPVTLSPVLPPITSRKVSTQLAKSYGPLDIKVRNETILTGSGVLRNAANIGTLGDASLIATVEGLDGPKKAIISVNAHYPKPFAMIECKRVGVEEGMSKGPQTIEKAKQGAYVAKAVSSLQKIRDANGALYGVIPLGDKFYTKPYQELIAEIIKSKDPALYKDFVLTIGVVSNHGNWFTSDNPNKEMKVLSQSYDWLVFLTDFGISEFISQLLINPENKYELVKEVFLSSYQNRTTVNRFTKVKVQYEVHLLLSEYFRKNREKIEHWFNVITPPSASLDDLQGQLATLAGKEWS